MDNTHITKKVIFSMKKNDQQIVILLVISVQEMTYIYFCIQKDLYIMHFFVPFK